MVACRSCTLARFSTALETKLVGRAVNRPAFDPATSHPDAETVMVMIAAELATCRASPNSTVGVRPNSPPQMTSVSSNIPRCFRSVINAAIGLIDLSAECLRWFASMLS